MDNCFSDGYGIIPKKVMRDKSTTVYAKAVLAYMLSFTGAGKTECWPSIDAMANDLCVNRCTVMKAINCLELTGYIKKSKLYDNEPLKKANKYTLDWLYSEVDDIDSRSIPKRPTKSISTTHEVDQNDTNINISNNNNLNNKNKATNVANKPKLCDLVIPANLNTEVFRETWNNWIEYKRKTTRISFDEAALTLEWLAINKSCPADAVECIKKSIRNGWKGCCYESNNKNTTQTKAVSGSNTQEFIERLNNKKYTGPDLEIPKGL